MSTTINLRDFYPWYTNDEFVEVSEEVAAELIADKRYEKAHERNKYRHKAHYSLDVDDGIEASALACHNDNPERVFAMMERHCNLCRALNSLPEIQGRRVDAYLILGKTQKEIADAEGVCEEAVRKSINKGIAAMKKNYEIFDKGGWVGPDFCHGI
jgi:RNA polymerase sigma-70 factor (ECF subfamily)